MLENFENIQKDNFTEADLKKNTCSERILLRHSQGRVQGWGAEILPHPNLAHTIK